MKLLFDQNLSFKLCQQLADLLPTRSQVRMQGLAEADDRTIWQYAKANDFTLVSHDADFAEMAALLGPPPKVIWLRGGNQPTAAIANLLRGRPASSPHSSTTTLRHVWRFISREVRVLTRSYASGPTSKTPCSAWNFHDGPSDYMLVTEH